MTEELVLQVGREALYLIVYLAAPLLLSALLAGLVIGVFQAATQIQEQTLSFIPKLMVLLDASKSSTSKLRAILDKVFTIRWNKSTALKSQS